MVRSRAALASPDGGASLGGTPSSEASGDSLYPPKMRCLIMERWVGTIRGRARSHARRLSLVSLSLFSAPGSIFRVLYGAEDL